MTASNTAKKKQRLKAPILVNSAEVEVMRALRRQGRISRTEISSITGWSKAKASQEIRSLVNKGYLVEVGEGASQGGRKPRLLRINDQLGYIAGIDIGATSLDIALADVTGLILQQCSEPTDVKLPPETVFGRCCELLLNLLQTHKATPDQILGIGIGVPGPVDFSRGVLVAPPLMPEWENFLIRDFFKKTFPSSFVVVDNDVNIMALGEQSAGEGINVDHFIFVKIGTGIGAGIVSNGKIHRGSDGSAGDIGHICVDKNGPLCACGNKGCLEAMTAGPSVTARAMEAIRNGSSPTLRQIAEGTVKSQFTDSWMFEKQGLRLFMDGMGPGYAFEVNTLKSTLEVFIGDAAAEAVADAESALEKATASRGLLAVQYNEADLYGYTDENEDAADAFLEGRDGSLPLGYGLEITKLCMAAYMAAERKMTIDLTDPKVQKELETYVPLIQQGKGADVLNVQ